MKEQKCMRLKSRKKRVRKDLKERKMRESIGEDEEGMKEREG